MKMRLASPDHAIRFPPFAVTNLQRGDERRGPTTLLSFSFPSALAESGIRSTRTLPGSPPSSLSVSHALAGLRPLKPPGLLASHNALGIPPSGPCSSRRSSSLSKAHPLLPLADGDIRNGRRTRVASEASSPRKSVPLEGFLGPATADALLVFSPRRFSRSPPQGRPPGPSSHALHQLEPQAASVRGHYRVSTRGELSFSPVRRR